MADGRQRENLCESSPAVYITSIAPSVKLLSCFHVEVLGGSVRVTTREISDD